MVDSSECFILRTDHRSPLNDLEPQGRSRKIPELYVLPHVAGWESYNLHDLEHVFWARSELCTDPAQYLITLG